MVAFAEPKSEPFSQKRVALRSRSRPRTPENAYPRFPQARLGSRFYNPTTGRFLSRDPIWEEASAASNSRKNGENHLVWAVKDAPALEYDRGGLLQLQREVLTAVAIYQRRGFPDLARSTKAIADNLLIEANSLMTGGIDSGANLYAMARNNAISFADMLRPGPRLGAKGARPRCECYQSEYGGCPADADPTPCADASCRIGVPCKDPLPCRVIWRGY